MSLDDISKLGELMRLHDEAFDAAMEFDGHCKPSDGTVSVQFTNHTDRRGGMDGLTITSVEVYAYVVGPSRQHYFDSIDEALTAVQGWHAETMEWVRAERAEMEASR